MSGDLAVQYSKLPEWLLARRIIPEDYARLLQAVEVKVSAALKEYIPHEAANAIIEERRESMDYFAAKEVYEAVAKSPEGQQKTLLGAHVHPAAAKWKAVQDAYRRRNLGWVSAARTLIQNVSYEIPALKKHAASCERQVAECTQRQTDLLRIEVNAKQRNEELLRELGIEGFDPGQEMKDTAAKELPRINAELAELLRRHGKDLVSYYRAFAEHAAGGKLPSAHLILPLLNAVACSDDLPTAEEVELQVPALREAREDAARKLAKDLLTKPEPQPQQTIAQPEEGINWAAMMSSESAGDSGINWDFDASASCDAIEASAEPIIEESGGIDWSAISFEGLEITAGKDTDDANVTAHEGLLADPQARELLYQDVVEVKSFLQARCDELSSSTSEDFGPKEAEKSLQEVQALKEVTVAAEELLAGRRTHRLLLLRSSHRYLEQQLRRLEVAKTRCGKPALQRAALEKVKADQAAEAKRTRVAVEKLRAATLKVQQQLEAELSAHFKSSVRIVGDIAQI